MVAEFGSVVVDDDLAQLPEVVFIFFLNNRFISHSLEFGKLFL